MISKLEIKQKAIELRKKGKTYKDITAVLGVSKGTLSGWFRYLELSPLELDNLEKWSKEKSNRGRINASISNRNKRIQRENKISEEAKKQFEIFSMHKDFLIGVSLYWAEGSKKDSAFSFINSDPDMVVFMKKWMGKYLGVTDTDYRIRFFIHEIYAHEKLEEYWSQILDFPIHRFQKTIYKPTIHFVKKNPNYKGCLRIYINSVDHLRRVMTWQKMLLSI